MIAGYLTEGFLAAIVFSRLKERLGRRRREALAGVVLGILVALAACAVWDFWK